LQQLLAIGAFLSIFWLVFYRVFIDNLFTL
jgi:hypothetical protein